MVATGDILDDEVCRIEEPDGVDEYAGRDHLRMVKFA